MLDEDFDQEFIPRPKVGSPSKYTPEACAKVVEAASQGKHVAGMILAAGANSRSTFYAWQKEYPEFKAACDYAKLVALDKWEEIGLMGTIGQIKNFNATSWTITMNNKFSEEYSRTGSSSGTTNVTVNTVNLTDEQKVDRLKGLMQKLTTTGINAEQLLNMKNDDENK